MKKVIDITVDIETTGLSPTAAVMSIAAVAWNRYEKKSPFLSETFYRNVDLTSQFIDGFSFDAETAHWWHTQSADAKDALLAAGDSPKISVKENIADLFAFIEQVKNEYSADEVCLWSQGSDFDIAVLRNIAAKYSIQWPIRYTSFRDHRTFFLEGGHLVCNLAGIEFNPRRAYLLVDPFEGEGVPHNPLYDCKRSIWSTWQMMKHLRCLCLPADDDNDNNKENKRTAETETLEK